MITGRDFVILSDDYDGLPTSAIHLFRRLGRGNRVFWFNTLSRLPRPSLADMGKVLRTVTRWALRRRAPARDIPDGVQVVNPIMVPWFKPLVRRFNRFSLLRRYRKLCARYAITDPIVLTTFPHGVDFLKAVPEATRIYYCVDDFLDYPGVNRADWARMEAELLESVDGLIVTSRHLAYKHTTACPLLHLPHGVDFEHFQTGPAGAPVPELEALPRPIVGFFGYISEWVDLDLIASLSRLFPDVSFVLLGRGDVGMQRLAGLPNVHRLGFVPYTDLPRYARYFDVGLIPFVLNQLTLAVNPVKLMEYLALGLPVLSTRLPELESIDGPIRLAVTYDEFATGLREVLALLGPRTSVQARAVARRNTWDQRVEQLSAFLEQFRSRLRVSAGSANPQAGIEVMGGTL
ncbi:MAG TPA: glycosyltransferase [Gemmataceae bacterium]|nr:glycosyltransferase [Gemmataceae bacterium]